MEKNQREKRNEKVLIKFAGYGFRKTYKILNAIGAVLKIILISGISIMFLLSCSQEERLSSKCDKILCTGTDSQGNYYELVGNQYENSLEVKIEIGIIKNNEWLVNPSNSFPFLSENGFFHTTRYISGGISDETLDSPRVSSNIQFIKSGTFVVVKYNKATTWVKEYEKVLCLYSCKSLKSIEIDLDEYTVLTKPYEGYYAEDGKLLLYKGDEWILLDVHTFEMTIIGRNTEGVYPKRPLSEGLIYASDRCFYDISMQKVIDLSHYNIDESTDSPLCFVDGKCSFVVINPLGKKYLISIDKTGKVLDELPKS